MGSILFENFCLCTKPLKGILLSIIKHPIKLEGLSKLNLFEDVSDLTQFSISKILNDQVANVVTVCLPASRVDVVNLPGQSLDIFLQ